MENQIRINVYRALRKLGIPRQDISEDKHIEKDLGLDEQDLLCFLFLVESRINCDFDDQKIRSAKNIGEMIILMEHSENHTSRVAV